MSSRNSKPIRQQNSPDANTWSLVKRLLHEHVRNHWRVLTIAMFCMVVVAAATAMNAWLMQPVLDEVFLNQNKSMLIVVPVAIFFIAIINGFANFGQHYLMGTTGQRIVAGIQVNLFSHIMHADLEYFHAEASGRLISNFLEDANLLRFAVARAITGIAKDLLMLVFLVGLMFYQNWELALIALVIFPIAVVPIRSLGKRMRKASRSMQERTGRFAAILSETILGARHVKAYGREEYEIERAKTSINHRLESWNKMVHTRAAATPLMESLGGAAVAGIVFYGGTQVISGETTPGTFFSFIAAMLFSYQPMKSLANLNSVLQEGLAAAQRIFELMDIEPKIYIKPNAIVLEIDKGEVKFDKVSFGYSATNKALADITFTASQGKTVAIVGPSGAGKSTLINLIPRFYDTDRGKILIDGNNLCDITPASLRNNIGLVSQEATLFNDTVRANISYGRALASEDEIVRAAKAAAAHDFISQLPNGYDTIVGEGGVKLSGGQRQRIAISRAMLKDAPILLLDEATSALDTESERQVQLALARLMRNRTTIIVAHRLSTIVDADIIHVLDDGKIVESGTHRELLARRGLYARLYAAQSTEPSTKTLTA